MKHYLSVIIVLVGLLVSMPAKAQRFLQFGLKGGVNVASLSFSGDMMKGSNRTGFFVGPMAELTIPVIGIGLEVSALYNQVGAEADFYVDERTNIDQTLKTIEIPVNLKWTFGAGKTLGAYLLAGPQFGFNVGHGSFTESFRLKDRYTTFNVGAGVKLVQHLQVGVNYNFGLGSLSKATVENYDGVIKMKKNGWQVSLAYMF